jgi:uncharacterized protein YneF (UPF0154 family)
MPPMEAIVAIVIALAIGWWGGNALFSTTERLKRVQHDPTASTGRRKGAVMLLAVIFVLFVAVGSYLKIKSDQITEDLQCKESYGVSC